MDNKKLILSEQAVLGSLLRDNDCIDNIQSLKAHDFLRDDHRLIFTTIKSFLDGGQPVDLILLAERLEGLDKLDQCGGLANITNIIQSVNTTKNVSMHAKNVQGEAIRRRIKSLGVDLTNMSGDIDQILETAERGLFDLLENNDTSTIAHVGEAVADAIDWADEDHKGADTGLIDLDRMTSGFNKSNLIIIAGRPSQGKSSLALQIAEHVAIKESVICFSLEMSRREIGTRMINYHQHKVGKGEAVRYLHSLKLHIDDKPGVGLAHIRSQCRKIKRKQGLSMIVIDYIQLMTGKGDNRTQEVGAISRGLKGIAKEFDIPVVVLSQLSRKVEERNDKRPVMSDLRDSGEIEQDADLILFIYRDETYNDQSNFEGIAEIICRKNRNGATGDIQTTFNGELTRFGNYAGDRILRAVETKRTKGFVI